MPLQEYKKKRKLQLSGEPTGKTSNQEKDDVFVIHKHAASHLHHDLRLADRGFLKSWALPKGLPSKRGEKIFAKQVEDHPFEYKDFEGNIPEGHYGAGTVMIWDEGIYLADHNKFSKDHISFELKGRKVRGRFSLVQLKDDDWIVIAHQDIAIAQGIDRSVKTGRTMAEIMLDKKLDFTDIEKLDAAKVAVKPMLSKPANNIFSNNNFLYEIKLDGYRAIAEVDLGAVKLSSRNNLNLDEKFKIIHDELKKLKYRAILDGEIVMLDPKGRPIFEGLQNADPSDSRLYYYVFDIISFEGYDLSSWPIEKRKGLLKQLVPQGSRIRYLGHVVAEGKKLLDSAKKQGFEGVIAKRFGSTYKAGKRSSDWLKIKTVPEDDFVVVGYTQPEGTRELFGSLVLAQEKNGSLVYRGNVGTGFNYQSLNDIYKRLRRIETTKPVFKELKGVTWAKPELVVRVKFLEITSGGQLRHPAFIGLKEDETYQAPKFLPKSDLTLNINGQTIKISNSEKIYFPELGLRKIDIVEYYLKISDYLLPYIIDRPQSLHRFPDGIYGEKFYHKDTAFKEKWLKTFKVPDSLNKNYTNYLVVNDKASLAYMINLGCIEINPWLSRIPLYNMPDILCFDIDPGDEATFSQAIAAAIEIKKLFEQIGATIFVKTSGASGLHIFLRLLPNTTFSSSKLFAQLISSLIAQKLDFVSLERNPQKRTDKVYLDYLQNNMGQTIASIYSIRPNKKALVSAPINWKDLPRVKPDDFDYKTIFKHLQKDPWKDFFSKAYSLKDLTRKLKEINKV